MGTVCSSEYSLGLCYEFAFLHQYVRGYPWCSALTVHEYCCIQMLVNATYIHEVTEAEGGDMEAMIGEEEHVREYGHAKILASGMDQKKEPLCRLQNRRT